MDYEKAYKEAHSRAEMFRDTIYGGIAEEIFPDLRESSYDEKIRKELIEMVKEDWPGRSDVVDWLERQGEQKKSSKVKPKFRIGDVIEVKPMKCYGKIFTGKPNKIIDITEESYIFDDGKAYSIELQDGWKLSEQKPADKVEPIVIRDFYSVFSREQVEEIDKRIEESQRLYNAKLRDAIQKVEDFPMTD